MTTRQVPAAIFAGRSKPKRPLRLLLLLGAAACVGASAIDGFDLPNAETRSRYQRLIGEFRCPKCLNESLASSGAPIAVDLRRTVRRLLAEGASDAAVRTHMQERYGDFVLYDPPMRPVTWLLWFSPPVLAIGLVAVLLWNARRRPAAATADERERAERLARELLNAAADRRLRERRPWSFG